MAQPPALHISSSSDDELAPKLSRTARAPAPRQERNRGDAAANTGTKGAPATSLSPSSSSSSELPVTNSFGFARSHTLEQTSRAENGARARPAPRRRRPPAPAAHPAPDPGAEPGEDEARTEQAAQPRNPRAGSKRAARDAERAAKRAAKEREVAERRTARVARAFATHAASGAARRDFVRVLASHDLLADEGGRVDVLQKVRIRFAHRLEEQRTGIDGHVTWQRLRAPAGGEMASASQDDGFGGNIESSRLEIASHSGIHVIVLAPDKLLDLVPAADRLHAFATSLRGRLPRDAKSVSLVVAGLHQMVTTRNRRAARSAGQDTLIDPACVQAGMTRLLVRHGVRTVVLHDADEVAHYLVEMTEAVAASNAPGGAGDGGEDSATGAGQSQDMDLIGASQTYYRRNAAALGGRAPIVTDSNAGADKGDKEGGVNAKSATAGIRVEGVHDLGNMYLSMLCIVPQVSLAKATAIRERYPTLRMLFEAYDGCASEREKELMLADITFGRNGRRIGPALSRAVNTVFNSLDGDAAV